VGRLGRLRPVQNAPDATPAGVQWRLDGTPIAGATGHTYIPDAGSVGSQLTCAATATATYPLLTVAVSATSSGVTVLAPSTIQPTVPTPIPPTVPTNPAAPTSTEPPGPAVKSGKPTASHVSLSRFAGASPQISFTLTPGPRAHPIKLIVVKLPRGISFAPQAMSLAKGIGLQGPGAKRLKFKTRISHGVLTITLASPATIVQVRIASPAITVSKTLASNVTHQQVTSLSFAVTVTDSDKATTKLTLTRLKVGK